MDTRKRTAHHQPPLLISPTGKIVNGITLIPLVAGSAGAFSESPTGRLETLYRGSLQDAIKYAQEKAAWHALPVNADLLRGPRIPVQKIRYQRVMRRWVAYHWQAETLPDANTAFHVLVTQGELKGSHIDDRQGLFRTRYTLQQGADLEEAAAWDVILHRIRHGGRIAGGQGVPYDTCPQCLTRHVVLEGGGRLTCQECLYANH